MAGLAEVDWKSLATEANVRALLEDLVEAYRTNPFVQWALAVWFEKSPRSHEHNLLALVKGFSTNEIEMVDRPLFWKADLKDGPLVKVHLTTVEHFAQLLAVSPETVRRYFVRSEVLHFDKTQLPDEILRAFNVITEPSGLIKGWYVTADEYLRSTTVRNLLVPRSQIRPTIGILKTWESADFETCRALVHAEFSQRWLPLSEGGLPAYTYYNDWQDGRSVHFLFQGGSLYQLDKFEVKTAPEYSDLVLDKLPDDRYPEVYLRAVRPPQGS